MPILIRLVLLVMGAGLITFLVIQTGPQAVWKMISALGLLAPLALIPYGFVYLLDTLGWRSSFPKQAIKKVDFWTFAKIRWAGEATNYVLPTAYVGGEALKVYLLTKKGISSSHGAASAVTSKTAQTLAQVLFLVTGALVALQHLPKESPLRFGMILIAVLACVVFLGLIIIQKIGFYRIISIIASKLGIARSYFSRNQGVIEGIDQKIQQFYGQTPRRFYLCVGYYLAGWMADTIEIWLVSHLIQSPITWTQALALEAFIGVAKILGMFVPGSLGVQESGVVWLCHLFGLPVVFGTSYALLRRVREICYAAVGWTLLYSEFPDLTALRATLKKLKEKDGESDKRASDPLS